MNSAFLRRVVPSAAILLLMGGSSARAEDRPSDGKQAAAQAEVAGQSGPPAFSTLGFEPATARTGGSTHLVVSGSGLCDIVGLSGELIDASGRLIQRFRSELEKAPCSGFRVPVEIAPGTQPGEWRPRNIRAEVRSGQELPVPLEAMAEVTLSVSDGTPPLLLAAEVSEESAEPGQPFSLRLTVSDYDGSGVARASGALTDSNQEVGVTISGTPDDSGAINILVALPENATPGPWMVANLSIEDKLGNLATYSDGDPALAGAAIEVKPATPVASTLSIEKVIIDPTTVNQGKKTMIRIKFAPTSMRIVKVHATFKDEQQISRRNLLFRRRIDEFTFETALRMSRAAPKGMWYVDEIKVTDDQGEEHTISAADSYLLSGSRFEVVARYAE